MFIFLYRIRYKLFNHFKAFFSFFLQSNVTLGKIRVNASCRETTFDREILFVIIYKFAIEPNSQTEFFRVYLTNDFTAESCFFSFFLQSNVTLGKIRVNASCRETTFDREILFVIIYKFAIEPNSQTEFFRVYLTNDFTAESC